LNTHFNIKINSTKAEKSVGHVFSCHIHPICQAVSFSSIAQKPAGIIHRACGGSGRMDIGNGGAYYELKEMIPCLTPTPAAGGLNPGGAVLLLSAAPDPAAPAARSLSPASAVSVSAASPSPVLPTAAASLLAVVPALLVSPNGRRATDTQAAPFNSSARVLAAQRLFVRLYKSKPPAMPEVFIYLSGSGRRSG
jgi:hypothetical protein